MKKTLLLILVLMMCLTLLVGCDTGVLPFTTSEEANESKTDDAMYDVGLGSMDQRTAQAVAQHAITWDQSIAYLEILDGEANGDTDKAIELALESGLLSEDDAINLAFTLINPQLSVEDARALAKKLHDKVGYSPAEGGYPIVSDGMTDYYNDTAMIEAGTEVTERDPFYGQSATYNATDLVNQPQYKFYDDSEYIVEDLVTGLMWTSSPFLFETKKYTFQEAMEGLDDFNEAHAEALGGFDDWRIPTIKELYSLTNFSGMMGFDADSSAAFFDQNYFTLPDTPEVYNPADRFIDTQSVTSTIYVSKTLGETTTMFGYNFRDAFLKGYPSIKTFTVFYVRGNTNYGQNMLVDNGDGTISDLATGLMWMKYDSGYFGVGPAFDGKMDWKSAIQHCESLQYAGYDDWRLPDVKQLHSIVDYDRSPDTTDSAAIDPMFQCTEITNMAGIKDWAYYWSSTPFTSRNASLYVSFGRGMGNMGNSPMDVHGAGAQRGEDRTLGDGSTFYPYSGGMHPQGDETRVLNMVRAVRVIGE